MESLKISSALPSHRYSAQELRRLYESARNTTSQLTFATSGAIEVSSRVFQLVSRLTDLGKEDPFCKSIATAIQKCKSFMSSGNAKRLKLVCFL